MLLMSQQVGYVYTHFTYMQIIELVDNVHRRYNTYQVVCFVLLKRRQIFHICCYSTLEYCTVLRVLNPLLSFSSEGTIVSVSL